MEISEELFQYVVDIRRRIHRHPETGFDLPVTAALVRAELEKIGFPYSEDYAPCSFVVRIGNDPAKKTLAVRADMDALPVEEKVDLPFKSEVPGKMHACGHDTHTAILLGVAKLLKEHENELPCNVRLFFQPSEECMESGAEVMVKNGAMDGVDAIFCTHCETTIETDEIGFCSGDHMAACMPFSIRFYGKTSHAAAAPEKGIDAIRMAREAADRLEVLVKECFGDRKYIWNVGIFRGGTAHNVIADFCELGITFRYFDEAVALSFREKALALLHEIAGRFDGRVEAEADISSRAVINDPELVRTFVDVISQDPRVKLHEMPPRMSSEDFAWYLTKVPGFLFRYGIRNEELGCTSPAHSNTFKVDERGFRSALIAFTDFIMNYR
jgi:amidohydrolase